jgi:acetyl esterase/lipase
MSQMTAEIDDLDLVRELVALSSDGWPPDINLDRQRYDAAGQEFGANIPFRPFNIAGTSGEVVGSSSDPARIVYLHGGAYALGSPRSHRHLVARLAAAAGMAVFVPEYPLAPEHPYPAALQSIANLVEELSRTGPLVLAGDSAGGALALVTYDRLAPASQAQIKGLILFSPWLDLRCAGRPYDEMSNHDGSMSPHRLRFFAQHYLNREPSDNPEVSPLLRARLALPPTLVQVASHEILRLECEEFATKSLASGLPVKFEVCDEALHVWHWYWPILESGRAALARAGEFAGALKKE